MGIHEAVHAFVSHSLGDTTAKDEGRLTLNPLKHIDIYTTVALPVVMILLGLPPIFIAKPVPFNPENVKYEEFGAALIGIAGPFSNLLMAGIGALIIRLVPLGELGAKFFVLFVSINVSFFVINMIPFPPLDGSRLLYAFAPEPLQKVMYQIESMGLTAIMLFFLVMAVYLGPFISNINESLFRALLGL